MNSYTEENYLKAIYSLAQKSENKGASTNAIATALATKASSVTDMVKKLAEKKLVNYKKYQGVTLTEKGKSVAVNIIRKHRLWEVFLVDKLNFKWDEVHDIAEQLEHIKSPELTQRLDQFLDFPKFDPHGDPIPDAEGNILNHAEMNLLSELKQGEKGVVVGVKDSSSGFLQHLENQNLMLGTKLIVAQIFEYDQSMNIEFADGNHITISQQVSHNVCVKKEID